MRVAVAWLLPLWIYLFAGLAAAAQPVSTPVHILGIVVGPDGEARVECRRHQVGASELRDPAAINAAARSLFSAIADPSAIRWHVNDVFVPGRPASNKAAQPATFEVEYSGFTAEAREAFQHAVDLWASRIESDVPIEIEANWSALEDNVLGSAGPQYLDDANTGNTWYAAALANAIRGRDDFPARVDILANFNNDFDNWYFGLDGQTPAGMIDFVTVVLHEIGHGLGFVGSMKVDDGEEETECNGTADVGCWGFEEFPDIPIVYDRFAEDGSGDQLVNAAVYPNPSALLGDVLQGEPVLFAGGAAASVYGARPPLYAPAEWESGSSYAHLDEATFGPSDPSALMSPFVSTAEAIHDPGPVGCAVFADIGWVTTSTCGTPPDPPPPAVPVLLAPADGSQDWTPPVTLEWEPALGASTYGLEISPDAGFSSEGMKSISTGSTSHLVEELLPETTYYWRVRSSNGQAVSDYSDVYQFSTAPLPPAAPELTSPSNGASEVSTDVTLVWSGALQADHFRVQVGETADFAAPIVDDTTGATSLDPIGLEGETQYFWRVRGVNEGGAGAWSKVFSFTTLIKIAPPPEPIFPADRTVGVDTTLTLEWTPVDEADGYDVQLGEDSTFATAIVDRSGIATTTYEVPELERETTYFWRVRSAIAGETGGWSPVVRFTTLVHAPLVPTPLEPDHGDEMVEIPTLFTWSRASGADYYQLQVAEGSDFDRPVVDSSLVDSTRLVVDLLEHSTTYIWRVRAVNAAGRSVWTRGVRFTTTSEVASEDDEQLPREFRVAAAYPNPFRDVVYLDVALPDEANARLSVYDAVGRRVGVVLDERRPAGTHTITWSVPSLASGMYLFRLEAGGATSVVTALRVRGADRRSLMFK